MIVLNVEDDCVITIAVSILKYYFEAINYIVVLCENQTTTIHLIVYVIVVDIVLRRFEIQVS